MFLHYPNDGEVSAIQDQFLYGADMLIAPVVGESARSRKVYIPGEGPWVHAWTGETAAAGWQNVPAELGEPPVFYRGDAPFADLFKSLRDIRDAGA